MTTTTNPPVWASGVDPDVYSKGMDAYTKGIETQGNAAWGGVGVNLVTGALNGILGYKNYRLAKKELAQNRAAMNINLAQQADASNQYKVQKAVQSGKYGSIEEARVALNDGGQLLNTRQLGDKQNPIAAREAQLATDRGIVAQQRAAAAAVPPTVAPAAPGILDAPGAATAPEDPTKKPQL